MTCRLLLVSGSLRAASTNLAVLATVRALTLPGVDGILYDRLAQLPPFNPDDDVEPLHPEVARLRDAIHAAHALVFSTPEYAGALPGSFKNLLDWTVGDDQPGSIYDKPVAWINTSPRGARGAHAELETVLCYAHAALIEGGKFEIPVNPAMIGEDGLVADLTTRDRIRRAVGELTAVLDCDRNTDSSGPRDLPTDPS
ncbi:MAG: NAD(P)H-dependent oxidoreductase [Actinobacteria bacterium]|nr:NAD(P)H-dependent oxidoreductase [Actinomycetota bacterium]